MAIWLVRATSQECTADTTPLLVFTLNISEETVAIKIISLDALKSKRLEELIFEEIKILQQMNHPNIVKFYEALLSDRNCYIIT